MSATIALECTAELSLDLTASVALAGPCACLILLCLDHVVCRLDAPWGTEDNPVEVTSSLHERIVGVPDPYDDSIIWWGTIEEGQPPKQIVETGEFFVLKRVAADDGHGGH